MSQAHNTTLVRAAYWGTEDEVRLLLDNGADPNQRCDGKLPLVAAIRQRRLSAIEMLLDHGANPNLFDDDNMSAMCCAVAQNLPEVLKSLIRHGGKVGVDSICGNLISRSILWDGAYKIIPLLVSLGVDVNHFNHEGHTPLMLAAANWNAEAIPTLLECGADLELRDHDDGWTAYLHAVAYDSIDEERALIAAGARQDVVDKHGRGAQSLRGSWATAGL